MGHKLQSETSLVLDHDDICAILTEYLCGERYGALADLRVTDVSQNPEAMRDFIVTLNPRPVEEQA